MRCRGLAALLLASAGAEYKPLDGRGVWGNGSQGGSVFSSERGSNKGYSSISENEGSEERTRLTSYSDDPTNSILFG